MQHIMDFLTPDVKKILFIPYAGVTISCDDYLDAVAAPLSANGYHVESIHRLKDSESLFENFDAIAVGGGNTFHLAKILQQKKLLKSMKNAVENGMPYIGWSAGSNITCPTIMTTNDMPIVEPSSFSGLNLIPFQINPHYTEATIPNHGGESREMRLQEFIYVNKNVPVIGLPESSLLRLVDAELTYIGIQGCKVFQHGKAPKIHESGGSLNWLL
ncbi:UNVERIFIED_CONTAM: hypothetical protein GTU68_056028 [Idotea baltica]|nr:hypothetical protein [Idotea baltica]